MSIQEKLEEFYSGEMYAKYSEHWTDRALGLIADGYAIGISDMWINAQLERCDYIEIHRHIINKIKTTKDFFQTNKEDLKTLESMLERHKKELFYILNDMIFNYCVR